MFNLFDDPRKRKINLGGTSSSASSTSILDQARTLRQAREREKQRIESAIKVQSWFRGVREGREVRRGLGKVVEDASNEEVGNLKVLRCLVILGRRTVTVTSGAQAMKGDVDIRPNYGDVNKALGTWSNKVVDGGVEAQLFKIPRESGSGAASASWLVLMRQISAMLLRIGTTSTGSDADTVNHLTILTSLLKTPVVSADIASYLLKYAYYPLLAQGIQSIPQATRSTSPVLPLFIQLATLPFTALSPSSQPAEYGLSLAQLLSGIFTIPLLPNILPPASLTLLSSQVPFTRFHLVNADALMHDTTSDGKMHLLATLMVFVTVKRWEMIRKQGGDAVKGYFQLLTALINGLPAKTLRPATSTSAGGASKTNSSMVFYPEADEDDPRDDDNDMDTDSDIRVSVVHSFDFDATQPQHRRRRRRRPEPAPVPDAKTGKRIQILTSTAYIHAVLPVLNSPALAASLVPLLLALCLAFPASVPQTILVSAQGQGLVRELYRGFVRRSKLGREGLGSTGAGAVKGVVGKDVSGEWPALMLLVELYGTSLMTMGDDEFFGASGSSSSSGGDLGSGSGRVLSGSSRGPGGGGGLGAGPVGQTRNPLSLDELAAFGRQLLNVAWVMWWQMGDILRESGGSGLGVGTEGVRRVGWESVRGRVTRCLTGIHARDSRKPFVPKDHWLVTSAQIGDVQGFVEAAVYEERQLAEDPDALQELRTVLPANVPLTSQFSRSRTAQEQSTRLSQHLTPRLGILNNLPFAIPFNLRVSIFRHFVMNDMMSGSSSSSRAPLFRTAPPGVARGLGNVVMDDGEVTPPLPAATATPPRGPAPPPAPVPGPTPGSSTTATTSSSSRGRRRMPGGAISIDSGFGLEELIVGASVDQMRGLFPADDDSFRTGEVRRLPGQPDQGHSGGVGEMVRRAAAEGRMVRLVMPEREGGEEGEEDGGDEHARGNQEPRLLPADFEDDDDDMMEDGNPIVSMNSGITFGGGALDGMTFSSNGGGTMAMMIGGGGFGGGGWRGKERVLIRRTNVAQDGFDRLGDRDLKQPIEIVFIDQWGQEESGIDGGGLFKEFFTSLCKEVFDTDRGLWLANKKNELYPNPISYATESHSLEWYRFIGRILGKAMYDGILVDVAFAGFFLAKWLGKQSFLDDLASLDPDLYNGLVFLKHFNGNVEDLSLNFTVAVEEFGETKSLDLIPNGSNIAVTRENRLQYIQLMSHYRLVTQIKKQSEAFFEGLSDMIDARWIRMFNQQEVQVLIGGVNAPISLDDLRKHTNYGGLYDDDHVVIRAFWDVVNGFNQEQRMALLRFVTSCSRPPLLGFKELNPNFSIRDAGTDDLRLPTASTCVNLLKLPRYSSERQLREKLLQAINANAGFDLS